MELESEPGFLGTSIQFAEQQIKFLEQQYADQQRQNALELIEMGFLESDYEGSDGEYTESETEPEYETTPEHEDDTEYESEFETDAERLRDTVFTITPALSATQISKDHPRCSISNDPDVECAKVSMVKKEVEELDGLDDDAKDAYDVESCISEEEYSYTPSTFDDPEWEGQLHVDNSEESVVIEHVFQYLDSYLPVDEEAFEEEQISVDVECTIWTVYNEESNEWQHIVDEESITHNKSPCAYYGQDAVIPSTIWHKMRWFDVKWYMFDLYRLLLTDNLNRIWFN